MDSLTLGEEGQPMNAHDNLLEVDWVHERGIELFGGVEHL